MFLNHQMTLIKTKWRANVYDLYARYACGKPLSPAREAKQGWMDDRLNCVTSNKQPQMTSFQVTKAAVRGRISVPAGNAPTAPCA